MSSGQFTTRFVTQQKYGNFRYARINETYNQLNRMSWIREEEFQDLDHDCLYSHILSNYIIYNILLYHIQYMYNDYILLS